MITVSIITKNEEDNIEKCLESIKWADEIIIVDSGSTDNTIDICKKYNCKIITTKWLGFGKTKQIGVNASRNNWILSVDADEIITENLKHDILNKITSTTYSGFHIKRISYYLNKRINYSSWQTDHPLRLFNKKYGNFNNKNVHESVDIIGEVSHIRSHLKHYPFPNIKTHIIKINLYSELGAQNLYDENKTTSLLYALASGWIKFFKMYMLKRGFLDGKEGLILALLSGFSSTLKYLKLWVMSKNR
ncbi:MAG: glycosyltransferase family 2 protein [Lentimicrobiaceae bacterium]|jgi:glycosyltransferase involved in cell wall biosynthesis|nr:glycosyltransferase family 2 protein [Lentimicrobiaceae bacterium]